jgi:anti-sigma B factor antagonist
MFDPAGADGQQYGLTYEHTRVGDTAVLDLRGEIDLATGDDLAVQLGQALAPVPGLLVVDLTAVDFLGSAGLSALIVARDNAERQGTKIRLVCNRTTRRTIELTGLTEQFTVTDDRAEALRQS